MLQGLKVEGDADRSDSSPLSGHVLIYRRSLWWTRNEPSEEKGRDVEERRRLNRPQQLGRLTLVPEQYLLMYVGYLEPVRM